MYSRQKQAKQKYQAKSQIISISMEYPALMLIIPVSKAGSGKRTCWCAQEITFYHNIYRLGDFPFHKIVFVVLSIQFLCREFSSKQTPDKRFCPALYEYSVFMYEISPIRYRHTI
jgi:hypothetical protein